jgi:phospholipid transport system substrate-binding protein
MIDSGSTLRTGRLARVGALCGALVLTLALRAHAAEPAAGTAKKAATKTEAAPKSAKAQTASAPPADSSPKAELKKSNDQLKKVLQKVPAGQRDSRNTEVRKVVGQFLDFEELSRRSLARHWDTLNAKQRTDFVNTLRDLVESNYIKQIHGQADYDLKFEKETKEGNDATVGATLVTTSKGKKVNVALEYKMVWKNGHWVVYDVITDEQSLLENYRAEFNKIITKDGFDALLKRMRKKLEEKTE